MRDKMMDILFKLKYFFDPSDEMVDILVVMPEWHILIRNLIWEG